MRRVQAVVAAERSSLPANLPRGGEGQISVIAEDRGDAGAGGSTTVLTDRLPQGLTAQTVLFGLGTLSIPYFGELCSVLPAGSDMHRSPGGL